MSGDISSREYWTEIAAIAAEVTREARAYERDISDVLHETIDGHQWVIYTAYNFDVAKLSPNSDAWEEWGITAGPMFDAQRAYCAMHADVCEHSDFDNTEDEE